MDATALSRLLTSASLSEFEDALTARLDALNACVSGRDKRALMELLKQAGCSKMGVRQRLVTALLDAAAAPTVPDDASATDEQANLFRKLGDEAFGRKDLPGAERWFSQGLAARPTSALLLSRMAACALASSPPAHERALLHLGSILAVPEKDDASMAAEHTEARFQAARCCQELGRLDDSVEHYDAILRREGVGEAAVEEYLRQRAATAATTTKAATATGLGGLSEVARRAADGRTDASYAQGQLAKARQMASEGRTVEALQAARSVRQACGASSLGTLLAIDAYERVGRLAEATEAAQDGIKRLPNDPSCRIVWARLIARGGDVPRAESDLSALCEKRPRDERAAKALKGLLQAKRLKEEGNAAYGSGQYERAISSYSDALAADIECFLAPLLHGNRSQAYMKLGQLSKALDDCDEAAKVDETAIKPRLRRAACRLELSQPEEALADFERVLELEPENAAALAGIERAEEVASGSDGRKGGMLDFEGERLDPYETLDVPKDANLVQLKAAFRKLVLKWHPDKHEGEGDAAIAYAVRQFKRVRIAYSVLSDPNERARLDEEGVLTVNGGGASGGSGADGGPIKPFHEYYSVTTPEGYTRGGGDSNVSRRYDPMVGATDWRGKVTAAEKVSRKMIKAQEEAIRLKGPDEARRLLAPGESPNSGVDAYNKYWDRQMELRNGTMKEESAPMHKKGQAPKLVAQTRYMPLEEEHRDDVQKSLMQGVGPMRALGHKDD